MNLAGKILVVLITVVSLVFMVLAVAVFSTQTNWRGAVAEKDSKIKEKQKAVEKLQADYTKLQKSLTDELTAHAADQKKAATELQEAQSSFQQLLARYDETRKQAIEDTDRAKKAMDEVQKRRDEAGKQAQQLKKTIQDKEDVARKAFETGQQIIELQTQIAVAEAHNKELKSRAEELTAILAEKGFSANPKEKDRLANPPEVEGVVRRVADKLVEISLGADDGLRPGHRLEVYRVRPKEQYLGRVVVQTVDPNQAVCRVLPELKQGAIQEGDLVSTRIVARR